MSITNFLAGIPVNANLRIKIEELLAENTRLSDENLILKNKVLDYEAEIDKLKKPKDPSVNPYMAKTQRV